MPRLPRLSGREAIRALERLGFAQVRQRGSHVVLREEAPEGPIGCVIPLHDELAVGTLRWEGRLTTTGLE
jgi:predicted RNA binding protein YcfA (HicA-like mRNA interferase family)